MKNGRLVKAMLTCGVVAACMFALAACAGNDASSGVAATVNGTEISEQAVTDSVEHSRKQSGLSDDEQWGKYLVQNDMTAEDVRSTHIDRLVDKELIRQAAADLDISVSDDEVQEAIDSFKENYSDDDKWRTALDNAGFTEETYFENIQESMIEQQVGDHFEDEAEVTDEDYVSSAQTYASYYDSAKRVSEIVIDVDTSDEDAVAEAQSQAEDIVSRLNSGSLDFADAAREYSTADSKENGGDIGWDKLETFDEDYSTVLTDLEAGQVSDPTTGTGKIFILKVTEVYDAPDDATTITSLDQIPEAFQENIKQMAVSVKANTLYTDWLDEIKDNADIEINDMPSGLPYDIDLTPYETDEDEDADADADALATDTTDTTDADAVATDTATTDADAAAVADADAADAATADTATAEATEETADASASADSAAQ